MWTFNHDGYPEPGSIYFQFKAMESLVKIEMDYVKDVDIRDYNLWMMEKTPVILVLFDATRKRAYWLFVQRYFEDTAHQPKKGAKTVRVRVPTRQAVNRVAIVRMREFKQETQFHLMGAQP
jgi:hypothetical protein